MAKAPDRLRPAVEALEAVPTNLDLFLKDPYGFLADQVEALEAGAYQLRSEAGELHRLIYDNIRSGWKASVALLEASPSSALEDFLVRINGDFKLMAMAIQKMFFKPHRNPAVD